MKNKLVLLTIATLIITMSSVAQITGSFTDSRDGKVYKTVKIGTQIWMAENLTSILYRNSDTIPNITDNASWGNLTSGANCNYNNDTINAKTYGKLYNWYAINDKRGIAPNGWHVPTEAEWQILIDYLGGIFKAGEKLKEKGHAHWNIRNIATNSSGFRALPGGTRSKDGSFYDDIGNFGTWWTSDEGKPTPKDPNHWSSEDIEPNSAGARYLSCSPDAFGSYYPMRSGLSVRCIKD
jgi:uncharacterized protein (TIGR02145 family)